MNGGGERAGATVAGIGEYCRKVEAHLTRANGGHLVRVVGPAFELVKGWAADGVPLSVVFRAIDDKAERHRAGSSTHPLRIEFCEADVRDAFTRWRRAVGVAHETEEGDPASGAAGAGTETRGPSLTRHLDRVVERLTRVAGRMDLPEAVRDIAGSALAEVAEWRAQAPRARGAAREAIVERLGPLQRAVIAAARAAASPALITELEREAAGDLAPYRSRLSGGAWQQALGVTVDRLLRERFGLPMIEM